MRTTISIVGRKTLLEAVSARGMSFIHWVKESLPSLLATMSVMPDGDHHQTQIRLKWPLAILLPILHELLLSIVLAITYAIQLVILLAARQPIPADNPSLLTILLLTL